MRAGTLLLAAAALAGCGGGWRERVAAASVVPDAVDWRRVATLEDRRRLREWRTAWDQALAKARAAGHGAEIAALGALGNPDLALPGAMPPPGNYRCRLIKIGAQSAGLLEYIAYPAYTCRIDGAAPRTLTKLTGSQRPTGRIYANDEARAVFLGTLMLGDETTPHAYGRDRLRDIAGYVERIGERRWRVILPYPAFESILNVVELVPAS